MSNDVRGYLELPSSTSTSTLIQVIEGKCNISLGEIFYDELYNFPILERPNKNRNNFIFVIGDGPKELSASYLIDYLDYASEADIGFPTKGKDRLDILLKSINYLFELSKTPKMIIALTDSNQITTIKKIKLSELYDVIHADFEEYQGPPDTLYEIINHKKRCL